MKILLASTGRGAELAVTTAYVHKYREIFPKAEITVATCPPYRQFWENSDDVDEWMPITDHSTTDGGENFQAFSERMKYDIYEDISERHGLGHPPTLFGKSCVEAIYNGIEKKHFELEDVERKVFMYPTKEDIAAADEILEKHPDAIMISHDCTTAKNPLSVEMWGSLADALSEHWTVCYTGITGRPEMRPTPPLDSAVDLRDISYNTLYELSKGLKAFIGLDTATTWLCANIDGPIITLRNDPCFELWHTGMCTMGFRKPENTFEFERELDGLSEAQIIEKVVTTIKDVLC